MTEAELWQVVFLARAHTLNAVSNAFVGFSGYLTVAYFVGTRLSRFQALLASVLLAIWELAMLSTATNQLKIARHYGAMLIRDFGVDFIQIGQEGARWGLPLLIGSLIAASFYFMYQVRKQPTLGSEPSQTGSN